MKVCIAGYGGHIVTRSAGIGRGSLALMTNTRSINQKLLVNELLSFYNKYKDNPVYRADCVRLWKQCSKDRTNGYAGAYREALRQIGEV